MNKSIKTLTPCLYVYFSESPNLTNILHDIMKEMKIIDFLGNCTSKLVKRNDKGKHAVAG